MARKNETDYGTAAARAHYSRGTDPAKLLRLEDVPWTVAKLSEKKRAQWTTAYRAEVSRLVSMELVPTTYDPDCVGGCDKYMVR